MRSEPLRCRLRVSRRFEIWMLLILLAIVALIVPKFWNRPIPLWQGLLVGMPFLFVFMALARSLFAQSPVLVLDETGIEMERGSLRGHPKPWRVAWNEVRSTAMTTGPIGEELTVVTAETRLTAPLDAKVLGWRLERQSELFAALTARGLAPIRDPEARGEVRSFFLNDGDAPSSTRRVIACLLAILAVIAILEIPSRRWDRLMTNSIFALIMGSPFLIVARSARRLDLSDEAVSLRSISPRGLQAILHLNSAEKTETMWTLAWSSLQRVRLDPSEGRATDLWLELEADHARYRVRYQSAYGTIDEADELRRLFTARGFPIEPPSV